MTSSSSLLGRSGETLLGRRGLAALRDFVRPKPALERCDICAKTLSEEHQHLFDPQSRRVHCACDACAILFEVKGRTTLKRVPRDSYWLTGFVMDEGDWKAMAVPIGLAFFTRTSSSEEIVACYPSPAGPATATVSREDWEPIVRRNPVLRGLAPDIEAVLVNRTRGSADYFLAPIDECYRLTGLIRKHWRGFSGGEEAWRQVDGFMEALRQKALPGRLRRHD